MGELINPPHDGSPPEIASWPDSGGLAEITWRSADGQTFRQELGNKTRRPGCCSQLRLSAT
jgi:hypothetical protein